MSENIDRTPEENTQPTQNKTLFKVLVAEDNPVVRKGVVNFLTKWGFAPLEAESGDEAWNILEEDHDVRLAILDWNLPGISGMQVCQRLRIRTNGPYVYTIMFSARKSKEEQILALDGGADEYLVKPCKPAELRARLGVGRRIIEMAFHYNPRQPKSLINADSGKMDSRDSDSKLHSEE